jgi:hypothetical protein
MSFGSEEVIGLESGLCYEQRIELRKGCLRSEIFINCGKPAVGYNIDLPFGDGNIYVNTYRSVCEAVQHDVAVPSEHFL